jgi:predicted nucleic-acid-binding protein
MAALDTNVLVRFLVQDDTKQGLLARDLIRSTLEKGESLYVPVTVMLELEWVLRSNFGFEKAQIILTLTSLLATAELSFESETSVEVAVELFRRRGFLRGLRALPRGDTWIKCLSASRSVTSVRAPCP